ncbi:MAG: hypothetical protein LBE91_22410 [Tannerella sp.]|jgi:hypothetical protein|nr:hypothetical protein [Tannerella sp.]
MDIKDIERHYEKMSDDELVRIATTDADGLRPEVFGIIENEIKKRNLDPGILGGALAQNREYSVEEVEAYAELLRSLPCPVCGSRDGKLNGTVLHTVKSFIFFTSARREPLIACPDCLDKRNNKAALTTALLGWWGFPYGLFKTPVYIYRNFQQKKENRLDFPNMTLLSFSLNNIGKIEAYRDNEEKLEGLIGDIA